MTVSRWLPLLAALPPAAAASLWAAPAWALDSYRYLHVTIETPWMIFLFLLVIVLSPFILMAVLYWYYATKRAARRAGED